jgi:Bacterial SH3 domain
MQNRILLFILSIALTVQAIAGQRGVIHDPDGFTNVRASQSADSAVVAKVKAGETFDFRGNEHEEWWKVTLASGKIGYMHSSRIRIHATADALADTKPTDEINEYCKRRGIEYYPLARSAAKGEQAAMKRYFAIVGDGAAAETHSEVMTTVIHLLGDEKLAKFLAGQPANYRAKFGGQLSEGNTLYPFKPAAYMARNFPKTAKLLWPG